MPIKMMYQGIPGEAPHEVDVYSFYTVEETLECYATCWVLDSEYWITVPIYMLYPIKKGKYLNE